MNQQKRREKLCTESDDAQHVTNHTTILIGSDYHHRLLTGSLTGNLEQFAAVEEIAFIQFGQPIALGVKGRL